MVKVVVHTDHEESVLPLLKISQISETTRNIEVIGTIVEKGDTREVKTRYGLAKVSWVIIKDETGSMRLNLWRQQIDKARKGDTIRLVNAFVRIYKEEMELNIGSDGWIEVLGCGSLWK